MSRNTLQRTFSVGTICLGLALLASGLAFSRGPEGPPPGPGGPPDLPSLIEKDAERLGLDDNTREKIRSIVAASKEKTSDLRTKLHEAFMNMRKLLSAETPNEKAVMEQAEKIGTIQEELAKHHLRVLLQIRPLLTAEQVQELGKMREERRRHWGPPHRGAAFDQQGGPHAMDLHSSMLKLTESLNLTKEQQAEIRSILKQNMQKMEAIREEEGKLWQETEAKIQGVLTDEQRARFIQLREEKQKK